MKTPKIIISLIFSVIMMQNSISFAGYGDKFPGGYPNWQERAVITLVNACRMAPQQYRDKYIGNYNILLPANFPTVKPVFWNLALNTSARFHALDMGSNCDTLIHSSCDGTTFAARVAGYYTKSSYIAENIAYGSSSPQAVMSLWIKETSGSTPVPDGPSAGHRINLMDTMYKEMGAGYDYGSKTKHYWWVQDFGHGKPDYVHAIPCASHCFMTANMISFYANYFDNLGKPQESSVYIDNVKYPMTLDIGKDSAGTYVFTTAKAGECRLYYFAFTGAQGKVWRYPETGFLITQGEGTCAKDFVAAESLGVGDGYSSSYPHEQNAFSAAWASAKLVLRFGNMGKMPLSVVVTDVQGKLLKSSDIAPVAVSQTAQTVVSIPCQLPHGLFILAVRFSSGLTLRRVLNNY